MTMKIIEYITWLLAAISEAWAEILGIIGL